MAYQRCFKARRPEQANFAYPEKFLLTHALFQIPKTTARLSCCAGPNATFSLFSRGEPSDDASLPAGDVACGFFQPILIKRV